MTKTKLDAQAIEARKAYYRKYRKKNEKRIKAQQKAWREANKEKALKQQKAWREKNPDKVKEYQQRYWQNKSKESQYFF